VDEWKTMANGDCIVYEVALPNTLLGRWDLKALGILDSEGISALGRKGASDNRILPATSSNAL
jgi:hypothetical protein